MKAWDRLEAEMDKAAIEGGKLRLWWRDDDAIGPSVALDRLGNYNKPLTLAIIPSLVSQEWALPPHFTVAQHGYDHVNRAGPGEKKTEFPLYRPSEDIVAQLVQGRMRLEGFFDNRFISLFVPPWNRFNHPKEVWQKSGFQAISTFHSYEIERKADRPIEQVRLDTHIDLIDWAARGFIGEDRFFRGLFGHLKAKELGLAPKAEPTGILTHHLVHDSGVWAFLDKWNSFMDNNRTRIEMVPLNIGYKTR